jgi:hypothetical protein
MCIGLHVKYPSSSFSSGGRAYDPDAPQPVRLLCYPSVLDVPTFATSPSPRLLPERPLAAKGGTTWVRIMADNMPQIYDMGPTALLPLRRKAC